VRSLDHHALLARTPRRIEARLQRRVGRTEVDAPRLAQVRVRVGVRARVRVRVS